MPSTRALPMIGRGVVLPMGQRHCQRIANEYTADDMPGGSTQLAHYEYTVHGTQYTADDMPCL
eukprot:3684803-Rhodomonas_salina.1